MTASFGNLCSYVFTDPSSGEHLLTGSDYDMHTSVAKWNLRCLMIMHPFDGAMPGHQTLDHSGQDQRTVTIDRWISCVYLLDVYPLRRSFLAVEEGRPLSLIGNNRSYSIGPKLHGGSGWVRFSRAVTRV